MPDTDWESSNQRVGESNAFTRNECSRGSQTAKKRIRERKSSWLGLLQRARATKPLAKVYDQTSPADIRRTFVKAERRVKFI